MRYVIYGATTGQGDGIGRSAAVALGELGHQVRGLCRNPDKAAAETAFELEAVDIRQPQGVERLKQIIREYDPDLIWSACGAGFAGPLWALPEEQIEAMVEANVHNNILFSRICAPSCLDGGPHLVLTGSVAGVLDGAGTALYAAVKGFLVPFVRGQRREYRLQGHNPKISLLQLGPVRTTGLGLVVDALQFIGRQSHSLEILVA